MKPPVAAHKESLFISLAIGHVFSTPIIEIPSELKLGPRHEYLSLHHSRHESQLYPAVLLPTFITSELSFGALKGFKPRTTNGVGWWWGRHGALRDAEPITSLIQPSIPCMATTDRSHIMVDN